MSEQEKNQAEIDALTEKRAGLVRMRDELHSLPTMRETHAHPSVRDARTAEERNEAIAALRAIPESVSAKRAAIVEEIGKVSQARADLIERNKELAGS